MLPKKQVCTPRMERKLGRNRAREQPLPQRSDGEEEEEEVEAALSPALDSSIEAREFCGSGARAELEDREDPCIINTGDVSLSELVKSMHPYCLPTFTVCLDPDTEPVAKELLSGPVLLEIVPGEGESVEIPVVLQPLAPSFPNLKPQLAGAEEAPRESIPEHPEEFPGAPAQENRMEEEKKEKPPGKESSCTTPESTSPPETAAPSTRSPDSNSRHSTEAPSGTKCKGSEKGRGRERARKSRKKKAENQSEQARPGRECVAPHLHSSGSGQPPGQPPTSRRRAARPSVQVSDFLAQQLERARKEGQMELRAEPAPRPRGRPPSTAGASPPEKVQKETVPEVVTVALEKAETVVPPEKTTPSMEERPAAVCPSPEDHGERDAQPAAGQGGRLSEPASPVPEPPQNMPAAEPSEVLPKEAKPKALSLREYRIRMLHRQPSPGDRKDGEKQAASKWPSVPEPPTELAEIPCLVSPVQPTTEAANAQKSLEKPTSPAAVPSPAGKAPAAPASAPAPAMALVPTTAAPSPSTPMPFVTPNVPPAAGVAPPGIPPASTGAYALYPPVPSWPCFGPQPMGCHGFPPPPSTGSPSTFHMMPGLPPPAMAWPPPVVPPPPPFAPGGPYAPVGWAPPSYWPGVPMPPLVPPLTYGDPGVALQAASTFPAGGSPSTALLHENPPPAQPPAAPASKVGAASGPARPVASRVSDPRRLARLAGDSSIPKATPAPAQPLAPPAAGRIPPAASAQHTAAPQAATTQPLEEPQAVTPTQLPKAPPPAILCPAEVSPAAATVGESPGSHSTEEAAGLGKGAVEKALPEPKAAAGQEPPGQKSTSQAVAPPPPKAGRESSLPTKTPAVRPWRHQPLLSPVQPSDSSKDIVQAFISEIGERHGAGLWAEHHQLARLQCCQQPWVVGLVPGTLWGESGKAAPAGLQSVSSTVPKCCLQWMVWAGCAQTGPSWGCRAGCSCPCYGRHGAVAGFATASPPQHSPHHLGRLMHGEDEAGVSPRGAGRVLADLTCCALSLFQGLKPPTCLACWSSLRSLKVRMQHTVLSPVGLPLCHAGLPRLPMLSAVGWELGGPGCCCFWAVVAQNNKLSNNNKLLGCLGALSWGCLCSHLFPHL